MAASIRRACHVKNENDSDEIKLTAARKKKEQELCPNNPVMCSLQEENGFC